MAPLISLKDTHHAEMIIGAERENGLGIPHGRAVRQKA
jgi:hypothetical protein